jgi:2-amino-4-hydroxy-6-hydroxymethyldihydropteridine diphosphokinase
MARVYVGIGSNRDREKNVRSALKILRECFGELLVSSVYESEAVGFNGDAFYNLVVGFDTPLTVGELSKQLKKIEDDHGRMRTQHHGFCNRTLDIDILLFDDLVGVIEGIELPRNEITENAFVLWPLAEIAGELTHPVLHRTCAQLWEAYDKGKQSLKPIDFSI